MGTRAKSLSKLQLPSRACDAPRAKPCTGAETQRRLHIRAQCGGATTSLAPLQCECDIAPSFAAASAPRALRQLCQSDAQSGDKLGDFRPIELIYVASLPRESATAIDSKARLESKADRATPARRRRSPMASVAPRAPLGQGPELAQNSRICLRILPMACSCSCRIRSRDRLYLSPISLRVSSSSLSSPNRQRMMRDSMGVRVFRSR